VRRSRKAVGILGLILLVSPIDQAAAGALERAMLGKSTIVDLTQVPHGSAPANAPESRHDKGEGGKEAVAASGVTPWGEMATLLELATTPGGNTATVAQIPPRNLLGVAVVVDISASVARQADYRASLQDLQSWERKYGRIPRRAIVLLYTGWSRRWEDPARYLNQDPQGVRRVPGFAPGAVAFLAAQREILGVGSDALAPEPGLGDPVLGTLRPGAWQLLNLTNLERLPTRGAKLVIAPLRLEGATAPARVVAILP
jgi:kynurenine formamidase